MPYCVCHVVYPCVWVYTCMLLSVCPASSKRCSLLVSRGATQVLLHALVSESKDDECLSELLAAIHHLLAKLGPRGQFSSVKCAIESQMLKFSGLTKMF